MKTTASVLAAGMALVGAVFTTFPQTAMAYYEEIRSVTPVKRVVGPGVVEYGRRIHSSVTTIGEPSVMVDRSVTIERPVVYSDPVEVVRPVVIERPTVIERSVQVVEPVEPQVVIQRVEQPVVIEKVIDRPVPVQTIIEQPAPVQTIIEKPVMVRKRDRHLLHLGLPLMHFSVF